MSHGSRNGGKCWTRIRDSERRHLGRLTCGGTGSSNAPVVIFQHCFATAGLQTAGWITSPIDIGSGGGSCAHGGRAYEARLNLILPAVKWWSRRVTLPHQLACKASALLVCHDPRKMAGRLGAAPSELSFGDSAAQAGARPVNLDWCGCRESQTNSFSGGKPLCC